MNRKERRRQDRAAGRGDGPGDAAEAERLFRAGFEHQRAGRPADALKLYRRALDILPDQPDLLHMAGVAAYELNRFDEAARRIGQAVARVPGRPEFHNNLGNALQGLGRPVDAEAAFREALRLAPDYAEARYNLANLLRATDRIDAAAAEYERALVARPNDPQVLNNLGATRSLQGRPDEAVAAFRRALAIRPDHAGALIGLGSELHRQGRMKGAIDCLRKAADLAPTDVPTLLALAGALGQDGAWEDALAAYRSIQALEPNHPQANAGCLSALERLCRWDGLERIRDTVREATKEALSQGGLPAETPFDAISRDMDAGRHLAIAQAYSRAIAQSVERFRESVADSPRPSGDGRIAVGYLSGDFRDHAISHLIGGLFAHHDRARFRVHAYSTGSDDGSAFRRQVADGCDAFVDLQRAGPLDAARRIRGDGIDILVDLNGHTASGRLDILALRPAPVQVTHLGFPGTSGADFIDYVIADSVVVPPEQADAFSEAVVRLPGTYQANGPQPVSGDRPARGDCGLPEGAFVFACFCAPYKIEPTVFDLWAEILRAVDGSVLWLFRGNGAVEGNLRREAAARGFDPERLIFADRVAKDRHLARAGLADLALDTRIYGGHTTTSDMIRAGVPVVALRGGHFASRVGAGLLEACGLGDLVAADASEYVGTAVRLARDPAALAAVRDRVAAARDGALFDNAAFARRLERAFGRMWDRHQAGEPPQSFTVSDD